MVAIVGYATSRCQQLKISADLLGIRELMEDERIVYTAQGEVRPNVKKTPWRRFESVSLGSRKSGSAE
jgi:hypothetical protein